jgi:hypothetical protein
MKGVEREAWSAETCKRLASVAGDQPFARAHTAEHDSGIADSSTYLSRSVFGIPAFPSYSEL